MFHREPEFPSRQPSKSFALQPQQEFQRCSILEDFYQKRFDRRSATEVAVHNNRKGQRCQALRRPGKIRSSPPAKLVQHRTLQLIRHSGVEVMSMHGMVHLALTQPVLLPVEGMLPPPQDRPDYKIRQSQFLPQFPPQGLMHGFARLNPPTGSNPERAPSGQTDSQQENSLVRRQENSANRVPLCHGADLSRVKMAIQHSHRDDEKAKSEFADLFDSNRPQFCHGLLENRQVHAGDMPGLSAGKVPKSLWPGTSTCSRLCANEAQ